MKKKITFIIPTFKVGGSERVMLNIVRYLNQKKYNITLIVIDSNGPLKSDVPDTIEIIDLNKKRLRESIISIINILNKNKPDIIFSTLGYLNIILIFLIKLLRINTKIIVRESSTPSRYIENLNPYKKILYSVLYKILYPKADKIVAQCISMKQDLIDAYDINHNQIVTIYNPIDIDRIRLKMNLSQPFSRENINIVAVGRLVYAKGYDILFQSMKKLIKEYPNAILHVLGDGPLKEELIKLVNELELIENIKFIGFVDNPYPYLANSDLYVLSSRWEGFPNTILEALACGSTVVSTNCKSGPEEILGDNFFGYLAESENPTSLYKMMDVALREKKDPAFKRAQDFSIQKIISDYERLIDNL